jgi:hypothetical protein
LPVRGAAIIDGAVAGEGDEIADAARVCDQAAEIAIADLLSLAGADRLFHPFGRKLARRAADLIARRILEIAVRKIIGLPPDNEIGVIALDPDLGTGTKMPIKR